MNPQVGITLTNIQKKDFQLFLQTSLKKWIENQTLIRSPLYKKLYVQELISCLNRG